VNYKIFLHLSKKYFEISHGPKDDFAGMAAILNKRKKKMG